MPARATFSAEKGVVAWSTAAEFIGCSPFTGERNEIEIKRQVGSTYRHGNASEVKGIHYEIRTV